jgi:hypothetical protein
LVFGVALVAAGGRARAGSTAASSFLTPQGSSAGTANGDYISSNSPDGLDAPYRYFFEVTPGLSRFVVELFDADVGLGGATEDTAGRDRDRDDGYATTVTYTLTNPAGQTRRTQFSAGSATLPTGADNAWLTFFDTTGDNVRDNFGTVAYNNQDGLINWATNWTETNDDADPANGQMRITGGELRLGDNGGTVSTIEREVNLSGNGFSTATLTFDSRTTGVDAGDQFRLQASSNGGGAWTTLDTYTGAFGATPRSYNLTPFIATNTRIRFIEVSGYGNNDFLFIDNLQIKENSIDSGHWELQVDMSDSNSNDINALGIRAHDGTAGSGGTEINVYYDSQNQYGVNPPASGSSSRSYTFYPYITSGCTASENDFDYDSNSGTVGSLVFNSRTGAGGGATVFSQTVASGALSVNDTWKQNAINRWTSDTLSTEYGIWKLDATINTYNTPGINGNYANVFIGNYQYPNSAPTANPTSNTFRVYLPTDAGAAPVKPYLEQLLTLKSGTNPVLVGQTSRYQVTVRLVNPTPYALTFSTPSNIVTARIPGSGAVYAGNAAVGQGTIVSQPSVGGTGDITWNPGTLAAGATTILTYQVNISPTSAGQRIAATSTPASGNGTRAQFVDETGNTSQTRSTYLLGPVCELAVTEGLVTEAVVSSFRAHEEKGAVVLEWRTASESGTAGFYLYGRDDQKSEFKPLHEGMLLGLLHSPQGGTYRFVDESASPRGRREYFLVEVESGGRRRTHGPFRPAVEWGEWGKSANDEMTESYERTPFPAARAPRPAAEKGAEKGAEKAAAAPGAAKALGITVRESGLYLIPSTELVRLFGMAQDDVEKKIAEGKFALTRAGQPVSWYPRFNGTSASKAQGIWFYGEAIDSLYTLDSVYKLTRGADGLRMAATVVPGAPPAAPGAGFPETGKAEKDLLPATAVAPDADSDYWFWDFLQAGDATNGHKSFTLDAPGLAAGGTASLTVHLFGATATGTAGEHHVTVSLNGTPLGETQWQGVAPQAATFAIDPSLLQPAGNQVEVTGLLDTGAPYSISYVDSFELGYNRAYQAAGDALAFTGGAGGANPSVSVTGLSGAGVALLDISTPARPRWVTGATLDADGSGGTGVRASFTPVPGTRYLAVGPAGVKTPALRAWRDDSLGAAGNAADYVVITRSDLHPAAERLAAYRQSHGLDTLVADIESIYDEFSAGLPTPQAIRSFLTTARRSWRKAPRYVVLAGAATLDYRDLLGYGGEVVPPLLVRTPDGLFVSDNQIADVAGTDGLPDMAIGRLPVRTAAELDAYVNKIAAYEAGISQPGDWTGNLLLVSDAPDRGADFGAASEQVAALVPGGYTVDRINLGSEPFASAHGRLIASLNQGASLVSYLGHGGLDRLAAGGLLASADVPGLGNGDRLPVITAMTCTVNRFGVPGVSSLGELLVRQPNGGAAAVWSPSGLSIHAEATLLAERFYRSVGGIQSPRLGDRVLRALAELQTLGGSRSMLDIYNLLGDPALLLRRPAPSAPSGGNGTGE